eukprot:7651918-Alexandrium_andersonii.AAC.1
MLLFEVLSSRAPAAVAIRFGLARAAKRSLRCRNTNVRALDPKFASAKDASGESRAREEKCSPT